MMKNQLAGMMKQVQQMQDNVKKGQDSLATIGVEGQSGAGLVKITMTCKNDVKRVVIDPSLLGDDKDMLEDLVAAAFNDAVRKAEAEAHGRVGAAAGDEAAVLIRGAGAVGRSGGGSAVERGRSPLCRRIRLRRRVADLVDGGQETRRSRGSERI